MLKKTLRAIALPLVATPLFTGCMGGDGIPPQAYAGKDIAAQVGETITLGVPEEGSEILVYEWEQISPANPVTFVDGFGAKHPQPRIYVDDSLSGQDIRFRLTVTDLERLSSSDDMVLGVAGCQEGEGVIFGDCTQKPWIGPVTYDESEEVLSLNGQNPNFHAQWQILDSELDSTDRVLDIQFSDTDRFADVAFHIAPPSFAGDDVFAELETIDLTDYLGGTLTFDIRVLNAPYTEIGTLVTLQCGWPCRSAFLNVNQYAETPLGEWVSVTIPMKDFLFDDGDPSATALDITQVDKIVIAPPWYLQDQRDYHYQLNNIQLNKPAANCEGEKTDIFTGCFNVNHWAGVIAFDEALEAAHSDGTLAEAHANWGLVIDEQTFETALEVVYSNADSFSAVSIKTAGIEGEPQPRDFSDLDENSYLVFDLKVTQQALNELGVFVTLECGWPCRSPYMQVGQYAFVVEGEWAQVRIPVLDFLQDNGDPEAPNLDLTILDTIVVGPVWSGNEQKNFSYRLKNMRFDTAF